MKILITGAHGQLGNELKSMLESGRAEIGPIDPAYQHAEVFYKDMDTVDFSDLAQSCRTYDEYLRRGARVREDALSYRGIAVFGDRKKISRLTGSLPLLR